MAISYHLYFLRISKVWSMLCHGSAGRVQSKERYFSLHILVLALLRCFSSKKLRFIIFISFFFFDEASNFRN